MLTRKKIAIILFIFFILFLGVYGYFYRYGNRFISDKQIINAYGDIIQKQIEMDKKIIQYQKENYTMEKAKIIVNPYQLCPLTALIIFNTEVEESITVNINGKDVTETELVSSHVIPIYGLYDNYDNIVKLTSDNKTVEYVITTDEFKGNRLKVEKSLDEKLEDGFYFISPNFASNAIYDSYGNLVWYILGDYAGDIEFLPNGHFYISDPYQGTNGIKINYSSFLEIDYLGKIYNQYVSDYGYHHELVPLDDNRVLVLGNDDDSNFLESIIYIMNLNSGKIEHYFDMYDILCKIDSDWTNKLGKNFDFVINSAQYFKSSNELLISVRGLNSVMMIDMNNEEIKWIFGDSGFYSDPFSKYILTPTDNTRYPAGQHSAFITDDGLLGIHNNDFDMIRDKSIMLKDYINNYSSVNLYKFDNKKKTIETIWEYSSLKKEFSKVAGYFDILNNNNKLITYGWSITHEAYDNIDNVSINDEKYLNAVIEEIDENDNVIFRATSLDLIYRTYKIFSFYESKTNNFEVYNYNRVSDLRVNGRDVLTFNIRKDLKSSNKFNGNVDVYINRVVLVDDFLIDDVVDIFLVSEKDKTYIYNYKKRGDLEKQSIRISQDSGMYAIYVRINDVMYDTGKVVNFN